MAAAREALELGYLEQSTLPSYIESHLNILNKIIELELNAYSNPWSEKLTRNEFLRDISFRRGIVLGEELIAHSFSHLIQDELHILNLAVLDKYQMKGYGKKLLAFILAEALRAGATYATLEVRVSNFAAVKLYRSLGFSDSFIRKAYYSDNKEDALVMSRSIDIDNLSIFNVLAGL